MRLQPRQQGFVRGQQQAGPEQVGVFHGIGQPDGRFSGAIDAVVFTAGLPGYGGYILATAPDDVDISRLAPGADPDGDGAENLLAFLFGTGPFDRTQRPRATVELRPDGSLEGVSFVLSAKVSDLVYWEIEWSQDLATWDVLVRQPGHEVNEGGMVMVPFPDDGGTSGFIRLALPGNGYRAPDCRRSSPDA